MTWMYWYKKLCFLLCHFVVMTSWIHCGNENFWGKGHPLWRGHWCVMEGLGLRELENWAGSQLGELVWQSPWLGFAVGERRWSQIWFHGVFLEQIRMKNDGGKNQTGLERQNEPAVTGLPAGSLDGVEGRGKGEREGTADLDHAYATAAAALSYFMI